MTTTSSSSTGSPTTADIFADVLDANRRFAASFEHAGLPGTAARQLAVLTCMDCRIDPLRVLGLAPGDAKILRNAGARVTPDVLATLAVAVHLLNVRRIMVMAHTRCRMTSGTEDDLHQAIAHAGGPDTRSLAFLTTTDQTAAVQRDVQRIQSWPYLQGSGVAVGGFLYDVDTGEVHVVC